MAESVAFQPREQAAYNYREASRAVNIPATTIGSWVRGQWYPLKSGVARFRPLIHRPDLNDTRLSFTNLIEIHMLRSLRTTHDVSMRAVREALDVAENEFGIRRLLIHGELRTSAGDLFLDRYEQLVTLSRAQQIVMRNLFVMYLDSVEYDEDNLPEVFYPLTRGPHSPSPKIVALSPYVSFGRPIIKRTGVTTTAIRSRLDAGESEAHVVEDFHLQEPELDEALNYELAA